METTFDVKVYAVDVYVGKTKTTHWVLWKVAGKRHKKAYSTAALADSFRSKLVSSTREGVAFDVETGLPVTMAKRETVSMAWFDFACVYVDMKWPDASPSHRKSIADSLVAITSATFRASPKGGEEKTLRRSMRRSFSLKTRPSDVDVDRAWLSQNTMEVKNFANPDVLRSVLSALDKKLDGKQAASDTTRLRRTTLVNALDYAVEKKLLAENPMNTVKTKKHTTILRQVDRRSVANPMQARMLLAAVAEIAPRLEAFFALMYYAGLRPEEASNIKKDNLAIPARGGGDINLGAATPEVGEEWTDSGTRSEERALKHREEGVERPVPCCAALTAILWRHIERYGCGSDGRLFPGVRSGGRLGSSVYGRVWARARAAVFTPEVIASPLAKRPYDLRHACVSSWLNANVEGPRVAEWAGHSLGVLMRVYAKCIDGGEQAARARVEAAMAGW